MIANEEQYAKLNCMLMSNGVPLESRVAQEHSGVAKWVYALKAEAEHRTRADALSAWRAPARRGRSGGQTVQRAGAAPLVGVGGHVERESDLELEKHFGGKAARGVRGVARVSAVGAPACADARGIRGHRNSSCGDWGRVVQEEFEIGGLELLVGLQLSERREEAVRAGPERRVSS